MLEEVRHNCHTRQHWKRRHMSTGYCRRRQCCCFCCCNRKSSTRYFHFSIIIIIISSLLTILFDGTTVSSLSWNPFSSTNKKKPSSSSSSSQSKIQRQSNVQEYNICNGLSNQLLYHAASIAIAIQTKKQYVLVPNHYIMDGEQTSNDAIYPNHYNSIPLGRVFNTTHFQQYIENLSNYKTKVLFATMYDIDDAINNNNSDVKDNDIETNDGDKMKEEVNRYSFLRNKFRFLQKQQTVNNQSNNNDANNTNNTNINKPINTIPCPGIGIVKQANPDIMLSILINAFQPVQEFQQLITSIQKKLPSNTEQGTCFHHRDGYDWHVHCQSWSNRTLKDKVYRGNCLNIPNETLIESLQSRGINNNHSSSSSSWVYYCGDHDPPKELYQLVSNNVYAHKDPQFAIQEYQKNYPLLVLSSNNDNNSVTQNSRALFGSSSNRTVIDGGGGGRDISALIDFFVCRNIPNFIGNSVSTFSALQIAIRRNQNTYWYNSQSIPLADMLRTYYVPVVYTYTELSKESGKCLLKASITSVRNHMPQNPIHILYHGNTDNTFISWLQLMNVTIHQHDPHWRADIERMRKNGKAAKSNLFLHEGNYFGTWQRIDIPLYIHTEYCLLLDADTIVRRRFTFSDFGLNITRSIALSAEGDKEDTRPWNAGVMLMNIPTLRKTHSQFVQFVLEHVGNATFPHPAPSDQGAYLAFYNDTARFLDTKFNFKPYWNEAEVREYNQSHIIHFHGPKPHDYLKHMIMNSTCDRATQPLCARGLQIGFVCQALQEFAKSVNHSDYCTASFGSNFLKNQQVVKQKLCIQIFEMISNEPDGCRKFSALIGKDIVKVYDPPSAKRKKKQTKSLILFSYYNALFRGIKDYKTRRIVRFIVAWFIYITFGYIACCKWGKKYQIPIVRLITRSSSATIATKIQQRNRRSPLSNIFTKTTVNTDKNNGVVTHPPASLSPVIIRQRKGIVNRV